MSSASASKAAGNAAFKAANYPLALAHYTTALQQDPSEFTYPLNRALVHLKLEQWKEAEKDATTTLKLMPNHPKALFRRGLARKGRGELKGAKEDFEEAKKYGAGDEVDKELKELGLGDGKKEKEGVKPSPAPPSSTTPTSKLSPPPSITKPSAPPAPTPSSPSQPEPKPKTDRSRLLSALTPTSLAAPTSKAAPSKPTSATISTPPSTAPTSKPAGGASGDLMQAVSTRRLTKPSPSYSSSPTLDGGAEKKENAFEKLKREREEKKRVGFAAPGKREDQEEKAEAGGEKAVAAAEENTQETKVLQMKEQPPSPTSSSPAPAAPTPAAPLAAPSPTPPPPTTATTVTSLELLLSASSSTTQIEKMALLQSLPLRTLPTFFAASLTPDLLSLILSVLLSYHSPASSSPAPKEEELVLLDFTLPFLRALTGVQRFDMCRMFLEEEERDGIRHLLQRGREALDGMAKEWDV